MNEGDGNLQLFIEHTNYTTCGGDNIPKHILVCVFVCVSLVTIRHVVISYSCSFVITRVCVCVCVCFVGGASTTYGCLL